MLQLKSAQLKGFLHGVDPYQYWDLDGTNGGLTAQANRTREAIQNYLVHGGSCPLLDKVAHPQVND